MTLLEIAVASMPVLLLGAIWIAGRSSSRTNVLPMIAFGLVAAAAIAVAIVHVARSPAGDNGPAIEYPSEDIVIEDVPQVGPTP